MNFIVVADRAYGIGQNNKLLVHLSDDLKYFRKTTLNKVVVMGRKTLESLPGGKPFKDRINIVMTRDPEYQMEGVTVVHGLSELFEVISVYPTEDVFVVGGGQIYKMLYPYCQYGYITKIDAVFEADTFIEDFEALPDWSVIWESDVVSNNGYAFVWTKYENHNVQKLD